MTKRRRRSFTIAEHVTVRGVPANEVNAFIQGGTMHDDEPSELTPHQHPDINDLTAILDRDPSGWETQPTQTDYDEHKRWAIATYGEKVWTTYTREPWGQFGTNPV